MLLVIDCGSKYTPNLKESLDSLQVDYNTVEMEDLDEHEFGNYRGYIISGSPIFLSEMDEEEFLKPFQFIKETSKPVLGICFGHQILGKLFGSEISHGTFAQGPKVVHRLTEDELFSDIGIETPFMQEHHERITLPPGFHQLGTSTDADIEAMKHKEKPIWGVQFHPEVSGEHGQRLLKNFCELIFGEDATGEISLPKVEEPLMHEIE